MRNFFNIIAMVIFCAMLFSCAQKSPYIKVEEQKVTGGKDADDLKKGAALARMECVGCHRFYSPEEYSSEEWKKILQGKSQRLSLRKDQIEKLVVYFQSGSSDREKFREN